MSVLSNRHQGGKASVAQQHKTTSAATEPDKTPKPPLNKKGIARPLNQKSAGCTGSNSSSSGDSNRPVDRKKSASISSSRDTNTQSCSESSKAASLSTQQQKRPSHSSAAGTRRLSSCAGKDASLQPNQKKRSSVTPPADEPQKKLKLDVARSANENTGNIDNNTSNKPLKAVDPNSNTEDYSQNEKRTIVAKRSSSAATLEFHRQLSVKKVPDLPISPTTPTKPFPIREVADRDKQDTPRAPEPLMVPFSASPTPSSPVPGQVLAPSLMPPIPCREVPPTKSELQSFIKQEMLSLASQATENTISQQKRINELQVTLATKNEALAAKNLEHERTVQALQERDARLNELTATLADRDDKLANKDRDAEAMRGTTTTLINQLAEQKKLVQGYEMVNNHQAEKMAEVQRQNADLREQLAQLAAQNNRYRARLAEGCCHTCDTCGQEDTCSDQALSPSCDGREYVSDAAEDDGVEDDGAENFGDHPSPSSDAMDESQE